MSDCLYDIPDIEGGSTSAVRIESNAAPVAEENSIQFFEISLFDIDAGAIIEANIDITAISSIMSKSTGGGAFSAVGITQPVFSKAEGSVYCFYQFLAAQWTSGDSYQLVVTGIQATVYGNIVYVPTATWANTIVEMADINTNVNYIVGVVDDLHLDLADMDSDLTTVAGVISDIHDVDLPDIKSDTGAILTALSPCVQTFTKAVTYAANAGNVTLATVTTKPVIIETINVQADTAAQTDLTSAAVYGGASNAITFLDTTDMAKANIDAVDEQVSWVGSHRLATGKTIIMALLGTGATPVDLTVTITCRAESAGGYLA